MIQIEAKLSRRQLLAGAGATALLGGATLGTGARAATNAWVLPEEYVPRIVRIKSGFQPGTIHVFTSHHYLYWVLPENKAIRYGVGVGEMGRQFAGGATISRKAEWPRWTPTANMIRRRPDLYAKHAGGMPGGPGNPLGSRAMYLYRGGRDTLYRIHGTTAPHTIGMSVSNGCIRMINSHVEDLYERVPLGTRVFVHS